MARLGTDGWKKGQGASCGIAGNHLGFPLAALWSNPDATPKVSAYFVPLKYGCIVAG